MAMLMFNLTIVQDRDTLTSDGDLTFDGTNLTCSNDVHCLGVGNDGQGSNIAFDVNGFTWTVGSYGMSMNTSGRLLVNEDISCTGLTSDAGISVSGGDVVLDGDANVQLDHSLGSGETSGTIVKYGSGMLTAGDVYYGYSSMGSFTWGTVNHTSANSTYLLAVAIGTSATSNGMLLNGILYKSSHGFTVGAPLYLASSNGDFTTTVPTTSNYYARVLGYAIDASHIYFCPDNTWVKID